MNVPLRDKILLILEEQIGSTANHHEKIRQMLQHDELNFSKEHV